MASSSALVGARPLPAAMPQPLDRTARLPLLDLLAGAVGEVAHAFGVRPRAVGLAFQQRRAAAAAGAAARPRRRPRERRRRRCRPPRRRACHSSAPATGHARIAGGIREGHLGGVLIVLADEQHRQLPDAGQVQPLVEGAIVHRTVAEERHRHAVGLQQHETVAGAGGLEDARADDAAGAHQADLRGEQVHAAAPAARAAGLAAEQLGDQLPRRHSLGQGMAVTAVRAEDHVVRPQMAHRRRRRWLPGRRRCGRRRGSGRAGATCASCSSHWRMRSIWR